MKVELVINQYDFNLRYAEALVADLEEKLMTSSPSMGLENHPAFTLGHLVSGSALMAEDLGGEFEMPQGWPELFLRKGPGDPRLPLPDRDAYPLKKELLTELDNQHEKVKVLLLGKRSEDLEQKFGWRFGQYMPTMGDLVLFMCVNHEAMHLGQLAAWRRAMGLPSALSTL